MDLFIMHASTNITGCIYLSSAHQEALKKEIERLRQVYEQQNLKMSAGAAASDHGPPPPVRAEKELMS
jgi:hypothetical protein